MYIFIIYIYTNIKTHLHQHFKISISYYILSYSIYCDRYECVCERERESEYACGWFLCVKSINFITVNNNNETSTCCWLYKTTNTTIIYENVYKEHKFHTFVYAYIYTYIKFYIVIHLQLSLIHK